MLLRWTNGRANGLIGALALIVAGLMALFAVELAHTQSDARDRVVSRFADRAQVASALTEAIIASAAVSGDEARRLGASKVSPAVLDRAATDGKLAYAVLLDARGRVVAASRTADAAIRRRLTLSPAVARVAAGAPVWLSDINPAAGPGGPTIDLALAVGKGSRRRVLVRGSLAAGLGPFLSTYLQRVPTYGGTAYVLDSRGRLVGARGGKAAVGSVVPEESLPAAIASEGRTGPYGDARYFAAAPVNGSTWKMVLTSPESSLFASVRGARHWLPWIVFAAFGAVALLCLLLMRRVLGNAIALTAANAQLLGSHARLESTNALLRHAAELARSNAELEQFASIASHDLQEPLRKVQTFADQLAAGERDRLSDEGKDFLRRMTDAAGRMRALIDDLLAFSRVSTQGRPFVSVDLGEIAAQAVSDVETRIDETGANVTVGELPTVDADPVQMGQLLQNLLANALKFVRPDVTPQVDVSASVRDGIAELTVRDNGIGFEEQYSGRIFRAFERLNGANAYPGTGIGLALCRKIVERHHGTITASGAPGAGATFTVRLPVEQAGGEADTPLFPDHSEDEMPNVRV